MRSFNQEQGFHWHQEMAGAMDRLLQDPALGRAWLIEPGGETAGYIVICFSFSLEFRGRDGFVDELYIHPRFRGRGLGRAALVHAAEEARGMGVRALHLEVARGDPRLVRLYESLGYRERPHPFRTLILDP
jgi:ribosomal protein S18 acetylase RimI-like enzyme